MSSNGYDTEIYSRGTTINDLYDNYLLFIHNIQIMCLFISTFIVFMHRSNIIRMIKGDENHQEIAAASIVAKYFRDQLMLKYAKEYEGYFFEKNKGYPTKDHKNAINYLGLSNIHRKSFKI